jgi:PAS domain S-box-containing protein
VEISSHELAFDGRNARLVLAHDVTARRRAEAAKERLIAILEATPDLVAITQVDRPASYLNPAGRQLLGVGPDETISLLDHRSESARSMIQEAIAAAIRDGVWSGETLLQNRLGEEIPVSQVIIAHKDASGAVEFLSTVARDIRAQKQLDERLMQAQQRLHHVIVSNPAVLFTLKIENGRINALDWISENLQELLGYSPEEAYQPEWWTQTIHPEDRDALSVRIQDELLKTDRSSQEVRFRHRNGKYLWTRTEIRLIRDAAGRPVEAVGSWSDVTERKLIEEQFRQAQKMEAIGRLAGGVAHDFNNLLTIINGYGEVMLGNLPTGDPHREFVREMVAAGERASGLTRQLLAFSRKAVIEPKIMDLRAVVVDVDRMLRRIVGEDIQLTVVADPESGAVKADPGQIEQVILNLVVNARDAMPRGGRITIEVRDAELGDHYCRTHPDARPGRHVLLSVADTGHGMDQATIARVFEPFFTTKGERGTGIGLATVHGIAKLSGGHVAVYSEVGRGTTFKVYLPRIDTRPAASAAQSKPSLMPRGTESILLVEDEDAVRALTRHVLLNCGYRILEARDGNEALLLANQHQGPIDLLLTDVVMPRIGGRELATRLAVMFPGLKVLFLSGYTDDAIVRHGILEAEVSFLQKPFTPSSLAAKIREVLGER